MARRGKERSGRKRKRKDKVSEIEDGSACPEGSVRVPGDDFQSSLPVARLYVEEIRERDGALVRYCRTSEDCPQWGKAWDKRVDIIRHIQATHGIAIDIPRRSVGRPKNSHRGALATGSRSHRQAKTRFESIETRIKLARRKHKKDLLEGAKRRWEFSSLKGKIPYEEWLEEYLEDQMLEWEKGMPNRIAKMQARIKKGYNDMSRTYAGVKKEQPTDEELSSRDDSISQNKESEDDKGNEFNTTQNCMKDVHSSLSDRGKAIMVSDQPQEKLCKLKIQRGMPSKVHIDVSSPTLSLSMSNTPPTKNRRVSVGKLAHLHSARYGFEVTCDKEFASNIARKKASSRTMTLFVMWLESTIRKEALDQSWFVDSLWYSFMKTSPSERAMRNYYGRVDLSTRMFTFFPIVDEDHWTLVVFFNCHLCPISHLPKNKSAILFFDSLSMRSLNGYISPLTRVLQHLSAYAMCSELKMELLHPEDCHVETMKMPAQSNTKDCGFYIMVVMKLLLSAGLERLPRKRMFTQNWFTHDDVETTKSDLCAWVQENTMEFAE